MIIDWGGDSSLVYAGLVLYFPNAYASLWAMWPTKAVALTLWSRSLSLTIQTRSTALTLEALV